MMMSAAMVLLSLTIPTWFVHKIVDMIHYVVNRCKETVRLQNYALAVTDFSQSRLLSHLQRM